MEGEGRLLMGWKSNGWEWVKKYHESSDYLNSVGTFAIVIFTLRS